MARTKKLDPKSLFFVLGGEDNEMVEIKMVLDTLELPYVQPQMEWGKIFVDVERLPKEADGRQLVFVECKPKLGEEENVESILIDHHDALRENPASLLQVLKLLGKSPTLRQKMVAAIDSEFISGAVKKWPDKKDKIWEVWEGGYRKRFAREADYVEFKRQCVKMIEKAKYKSDDGLLIIYNVPPSYTLLAALADVEGYECCFSVGGELSVDEKPCFYCGNESVVTILETFRWPKQYMGRRYLGCRAQPKEFVKVIRDIRKTI